MEMSAAGRNGTTLYQSVSPYHTPTNGLLMCNEAAALRWRRQVEPLRDAIVRAVVPRH